MRLREYLGTVGKLVGGRISGWLFAIISIGSLFTSAWLTHYNADQKAASNLLMWTAGFSLLAFVFVIFQAQYDAWCVERKRYEDEAAKNVRPELIGEALRFEKYGSRGRAYDKESGSSYSAHFKFAIHLCNHRDTPTNIRGISLDPSALPRAISVSAITMATLPPVLQKGINQTMLVTFDATVPLKEQENEVEIDISQLIIRLVDGFGDSHLIAVRNGERLVFALA